MGLRICDHGLLQAEGHEWRKIARRSIFWSWREAHAQRYLPVADFKNSSFFIDFLLDFSKGNTHYVSKTHCSLP